MRRRIALLSAALPLSVYGYIRADGWWAELVPFAASCASAVVCAALWTQRRMLVRGA